MSDAPEPSPAHPAPSDLPLEAWSGVHRGPLRVVVNLAEQPREIDLDRRVDDVLFATGELPVLDGTTVTLPAESAAVLSTR